MKKIAVVLMNLGGPDSLNHVENFLYNLFSDHAIINLPNPFRWIIAKLISKLRTPKAKKIYEQLGGASPILAETIKQKNQLEQALKDLDDEFKVFIAMRYFHPYSSEVIADIKTENFDEIFLIPLYPQFSSSTTKSSIDDFFEQMKIKDLNIPVKSICCYSREKNFVKAHSELILKIYDQAKKLGNVRILFSAHGLPEKMIKSGDPYQWQVTETVKSIVNELKIDQLDYIISYQSKVGPMKWLEPATDEEIVRAGRNNMVVIIVPIAFVSEHSETLVELDIDYQKLAKENNITSYFRVETLSVNKNFIESLKFMCDKLTKLSTEKNITNVSAELIKICPENFFKCINNYE